MNHAHPDEVLDVVDDQNQVVKQASRQVIHDRNLNHRSVHLMIRDLHGNFLLQRRADTRPTNPGCWDASVSGHNPAGMDYHDAVKKEAREEIGFDYRNPLPVFLIEASPETGHEWSMLYAHRAEAALRLRPDQEEVSEVRWWSEPELTRSLVSRPNLFTDSFRLLFFLWRATGFVIPEKMNDGTYAIGWDLPDRLQVKRALLESADIPARVSDDHSALVPGGRGGFFNKRDPASSGLCVFYDHLPDAIALLYLSQPAGPGRGTE